MTKDHNDEIASRGRHEGRLLATASLVILAGVALAFALAYTRAIMVPFVLAVFIVTIVSPVLDFQVLWLRFPRFIAVFTTLVLVVAVMVLISFLVFGAVDTVVEEAGQVTNDVKQFAKLSYIKCLDVYDNYLEFRARFTDKSKTEASDTEDSDQNAPAAPAVNEPPKQPKRPVELELTPEGLIWKEVIEPNADASANEDQVPETTTPQEKPSPDSREDIFRIINQLGERVFTLILDMSSMVLGLIRGAVFVAIFMIFFLAGRNPRELRTGVYADIDHKIRKYISTKLAISAMTGILVWVSLRLIGLRFANVFGILAFLLNFIPSIGSIISSILPLPIAIAQVQGMGQSASTGPFAENPILFVILVLAVPGLIQMLFGNFIEPKIMGEGLNLHPVTILLALSFWGLLWGIVGMFLAAPITAVIRIVLMQFDTLKPVGNLLAGKLPEVRVVAGELSEVQVVAGELAETEVPAKELPEADAPDD